MKLFTSLILIGLALASTAVAEDIRVLTVQGFDGEPIRVYRESGLVFLPPINATVTATVDWDSISQSFVGGDENFWNGVASGVPITYAENGEVIFTRAATLYFQIVNRDFYHPDGDIVRVNFDIDLDLRIESWITLPFETLSNTGLDTMEGILTNYPSYSGLVIDDKFYPDITIREGENPYIYRYSADASLTNWSLATASIPEPSSFGALSGLAALVLGAIRRRARG